MRFGLRSTAAKSTRHALALGDKLKDLGRILFRRVCGEVCGAEMATLRLRATKLSGMETAYKVIEALGR